MGIKSFNMASLGVANHNIEVCAYDFYPTISVSVLFSFLTKQKQKQQASKINPNDKTLCLGCGRNCSAFQSPGPSFFASPSLWSPPAISLAITQPTQLNQSVLNFSWDLGDLLMNLQRGEKLTVLSYAWCCSLTWSQKCLKR